MTRRELLFLLAAGLVLFEPLKASAEDGAESSESESETESEGGGDSSSNSGSSSTSGSRDSDGDSGESGNHSGDDNYRNKLRRSQSDQNEALSDRNAGRIISLEQARSVVSKRYPGRVLDVKLVRIGPARIYSFKIRLDNGKLKMVRVNAVSGKLIGLFGFGG
ncbi:MAG: PepSY domain-containing protein [Nitratireductor sp.]|nr:PepSY domain-containing protein [Nitratireductor sp.]MCC0021613.1 PepSY domain-containing protein [Nitratireductor sp.]